MGCASSVDKQPRECVVCDDDKLIVVISVRGDLIRVNEYVILAEIGGGRRGMVYCAIKDGIKYALKEVERKPGNKKEVKVLRKLQSHPHIPTCYDVLDSEGFGMFYIVMEYLSGGVMCRVSPEGYLLDNIMTEAAAREAFSQICSAILYMHSEDIVHRDIKPENIIWSDETHTKLKVCDFSSALVLKTENDTTRSTTEATQLFLPPESSSGRKFSAKDADTWAIGISLHLALTGRYPWGLGKPTEMQFYCEMQEPFQLKLQDSLSPSCTTVLKQLLCYDVLCRLTLEEFAGSAWIVGGDFPSRVIEPRCSDTESLSSTDTEFFTMSREDNKQLNKKCRSIMFYPSDYSRNSNGQDGERFRILLCEPHFGSRKTLISQIGTIAESGNMPLEIMCYRDMELALSDVSQQEKFNLITIPIYSHKISGFQACARLRSMNCGTPIVGLTTSTVELSDLCLQFGMDNVMRKPTQCTDVHKLLKWAGYSVKTSNYDSSQKPDYDESSHYEYCHKMSTPGDRQSFVRTFSEFDSFTFVVEHSVVSELSSKASESELAMERPLKRNSQHRQFSLKEDDERSYGRRRRQASDISNFSSLIGSEASQSDLRLQMKEESETRPYRHEGKRLTFRSEPGEETSVGMQLRLSDATILDELRSYCKDASPQRKEGTEISRLEGRKGLPVYSKVNDENSGFNSEHFTESDSRREKSEFSFGEKRKSIPPNRLADIDPVCSLDALSELSAGSRRQPGTRRMSNRREYPITRHQSHSSTATFDNILS